LLIAGREMLAGLVSRVPQQAEQLMRRYWPGPLTLVLPAVDGLPSSLKGPGGGVAVRISSDPVASALVSSVGRPVTSTSANLSGAPPPLGAADAALAGVSLVLDDGPRDRAASTLVAVFDDESPPRVLRQGPVCIGQS